MPKIPVRQKLILVIFGLVLCLILLELGLRIAGFLFLSLQEYRNRLALKKEGTYRIMCLGESTTFGYQASYPSQLQEVLNQKNIGIKFSVINKGIPASCSEAIVAQLEENLNKYRPDMVITMMGVNDGVGDVLYENANVKKAVSLLESFRIYKLTKLLWLHITYKTREAGIYKPKEEKEIVAVSPDELSQLTSYKELEIEYKKAIEIDPRDDRAYVDLGRLYIRQGNFNQTEEIFKKAIEINARNDQAYLELGRDYTTQARYQEAEEMLKKAIEANPLCYEAYLALGWCYNYHKKYTEAEEMFKKAIEIDPENIEGYMSLGCYYNEREEYALAHQMFQKAIEINPQKDLAYAALGLLYEKQRDYKRAREYFEKVNRLRLQYYNPALLHNCQRLKQIVDKRGIKLVCVQYPMRSIQPLKKMFQDTEGIIFVDNEKIFKEAVKQEGYDEYFIDNFAGDFGHCTLKGNRLLAENIAQVIIRACFHK